MNLFWKKIFRQLMPTSRYEKQEVEFLATSEKNKVLRHSAVIAEYKKLFLLATFKSGYEKKQLKKRLNELKKHPDLSTFLKQQKNAMLRDVYVTFSDDFFWNDINLSQWRTGFYHPTDKLIQTYSFYNEKQANNKGRNIIVKNGVMQIYTRQELIKSLAWHPVNGFREKQFAYSSDVIQTAQTFRQQGGVFKAKIRCSGDIHHAFWLGSGNSQPHINIFHFNGESIQLGYVNQNSGNSITVKGINPSKYYVYSLVWTSNELIWYVNNIVVFRANDNIPRESMFPVFNSFIPEHTTGNEGLLEIDWVRIYQFNS